ncbi:MAG TPA: glycine cleavage system aminomethyltransferase GcvT [Bdellovibrionales bacterium]|nr:glycine cleavage system aminomethyltransferase GcvT [Bdellovibrionales bacterium]
MSEIQKTPLHDEHERLGGRMVEFAGWHMPVEFEGLRAEHQTVRENVGLFDVSHMGEIWVRGPKSLETLQWLTSNDVSKLEANKAQYSLLTNEKGGIVDDIYVYCLKPNELYLVCVNAANVDKDFHWMVDHNRGAEIENESAAWAQIAVQGPKARALVGEIFGQRMTSLKRNDFVVTTYDLENCIVACTGYTGEDGFEIFVPNASAVTLWRMLLRTGEKFGCKPIGLGARDTLRTEMKFSLYGHEIDDTTNPIEAGLGWVVKPQKGEFLGKSPIVEAKEKGATRKLVGFKMIDKGIPRAGYPLLTFDKKPAGTVTSGTLSPSLNEGIGIGYLPANMAGEGTEFYVDIRGRALKAKVVKTPFVTPKS